METYKGLAEIYDYLVSGVDFEGWADYLESIIALHNYTPGTILDLACGTGNTIIPMARRGYSSGGIDISSEMIDLAEKKAIEANLKITFKVADIRSFISDKPVDLITCFHDGLNYIIDSTELLEVFIKTARNLSKGGLFVFDLNALKWIPSTDSSPVIVEEEDFTLIYNTEYMTGTSIWKIDLTCFSKAGSLYKKFREQHYERAYQPEFICELLVKAGLKPLKVFDAFTFDLPNNKSKRHFYLATI
ncbi:MAG: class I SAM-dependent methyltransferase [Peptococcaceae bacterium]|nr:class I SAM-dependent methyltransferase [Peptococcaceae bacterium]